MINLLLLTPRDPFAAPDVALLRSTLAEAAFIGERMEADFHKPGADFFRFITFLGCSPVVALGEPGATAEICRVEIPPLLPTPVFVAGQNLKPARCPGCGYRSPEGRVIGEMWQADPRHQEWRCPACGRKYAAPQLNWRRTAGFGRCFLKIWGVFEGEAVPSQPLLELLAATGQTEWQEFYIQL